LGLWGEIVQHHLDRDPSAFNNGLANKDRRIPDDAIDGHLVVHCDCCLLRDSNDIMRATSAFFFQALGGISKVTCDNRTNTAIGERALTSSLHGDTMARTREESHGCIAQTEFQQYDVEHPDSARRAGVGRTCRRMIRGGSRGWVDRWSTLPFPVLEAFYQSECL
jgi:hypothetical protein